MQIGPFSVPSNHETAKLKLRVRMNLHGIVAVESVQAIEDEDASQGAACNTNGCVWLLFLQSNHAAASSLCAHTQPHIFASTCLCFWSIWLECFTSSVLNY